MRNAVDTARARALTEAFEQFDADTEAAVAVAEQIAAFPQTCMREDRLSSYAQDGWGMAEAQATQWRHGLRSLAADTLEGASRFARGSRAARQLRMTIQGRPPGGTTW